MCLCGRSDCSIRMFRQYISICSIRIFEQSSVCMFVCSVLNSTVVSSSSCHDVFFLLLQFNKEL